MAQYLANNFDRAHFPALYRCADDASTAGHRYYLSWLGVNLGLLVAGAIVGSLAFAEMAHMRLTHIVAAVMFLAAVATTVLLATRPWERNWYAGRAVAESVKSLSWKFICRADPFPSTLAPTAAIDRLIHAIGEILQENKHLEPVSIPLERGACAIVPVRP